MASWLTLTNRRQTHLRRTKTGCTRFGFSLAFSSLCEVDTKPGSTHDFWIGSFFYCCNKTPKAIKKMNLISWLFKVWKLKIQKPPLFTFSWQTSSSITRWPMTSQEVIYHKEAYDITWGNIAPSQNSLWHHRKWYSSIIAWSTTSHGAT